MDDTQLPPRVPQHRRSSSGGDPFQPADIYYGDPQAVERVKNRRRAFSSVRPIDKFERNGKGFANWKLLNRA